MSDPCVQFKVYDKCGNTGCAEAARLEILNEAETKLLFVLSNGLSGHKGEAKRLVIQVIGDLKKKKL